MNSTSGPHSNPPAAPALAAFYVAQGSEVPDYAQRVLATAEADPRFLRVPTRLAVLRALVAVARRAGRLDVHPGVRDLAVAAGVGEGTVKRALADLVAWAYVEGKGPRRMRSDAAEWLLKVPRAKVAHNSNLGIHLNPRTRGERPQPPASDLWRYRFLGQRAQAIYRYVSRYSKLEPQFWDIHEQVGGDRRTVRKHLAALVAHGLVVESGPGYSLGPRSVEQVAASLGLAGNPVTAAQRRRQAADRAHYREALAVLESRRRPGAGIRGEAKVGRSCHRAGH